MSLDLKPEKDGNAVKCNNFSSSIPTKQQKSKCYGLMFCIWDLSGINSIPNTSYPN